MRSDVVDVAGLPAERAFGVEFEQPFMLVAAGVDGEAVVWAADGVPGRKVRVAPADKAGTLEL